ncbi:MAG: hypothetical protein K8I60_00780 [Anaerolineae bacterium]|nr:hypothetical protein [Anaerolineae bacterium]
MDDITGSQTAQQEIAALLRNLELKPIRSWHGLYDHVHGQLQKLQDDRAVCCQIRDEYTNSGDILSRIEERVGTGQLYQDAELYICCQIVKSYDLKIHPLVAAGQVAPTESGASLPDMETLLTEVEERLGLSQPGMGE